MMINLPPELSSESDKSQYVDLILEDNTVVKAFVYKNKALIEKQVINPKIKYICP